MQNTCTAIAAGLAARCLSNTRTPASSRLAIASAVAALATRAYVEGTPHPAGLRTRDLDADAAVSRDGDRIVLDRGPVDVVYDIDNQWVEQSFVLDAAGAQGDLVLELNVKSDLQKAADGGGFHFSGARGGMTYSAAIVLDGTGRTASVPASLHGA